MNLLPHCRHAKEAHEIIAAHRRAETAALRENNRLLRRLQYIASPGVLHGRKFNPVLDACLQLNGSEFTARQVRRFFPGRTQKAIGVELGNLAGTNRLIRVRYGVYKNKT